MKEISSSVRFPAVLLAAAILLAVTALFWNGNTYRTLTTDPPFAINVTASPYNAVCDGSTDDTTAIQSALNAAGAHTGGRVQIPNTGHLCKVTSTLTIPQNVILEGESPSSVSGGLWFASTGNGPVIQIGTVGAASPADEHGGGLLNISVVGNSSSGGLPNQIGVELTNVIETTVDNVLVKNTGTAYLVDGGNTGSWSGDLQFIAPMASNVVNGLDFTQEGGVITDVRCCAGGYVDGVSHTTGGIGLYALKMHSSQFWGLSIQNFVTGIKLDTGTNSTVFFGARVEASGTENGTSSFTCNGSGTTAEFFYPHDSDVVTTQITNTNSATCALTNS